MRQKIPLTLATIVQQRMWTDSTIATTSVKACLELNTLFNIHINWMSIMLYFCIELNIIGPVDKNPRFYQRPIARTCWVHWVLGHIPRIKIHWVLLSFLWVLFQIHWVSESAHQHLTIACWHLTSLHWLWVKLLRSECWDLGVVKTVWVLGDQAGSVANNRTASSEVECFGWVPAKIRWEVIFMRLYFDKENDIGNLIAQTFLCCSTWNKTTK